MFSKSKNPKHHLVLAGMEKKKKQKIEKWIHAKETKKILNSYLTSDKNVSCMGIVYIICSFSYTEENDIESIFRHGYFERIIHIIVNPFGFTNVNWNVAMEGAAEGGFLNIVRIAARCGATDWRAAMYMAANGGHRDVVDYLIDKGADNFDGGLFAACEGGQIEMIHYMIENGAMEYDEALERACASCEYEAAKLMIEYGASNLEECLEICCGSGCFVIGEMLIELRRLTYCCGEEDCIFTEQLYSDSDDAMKH